MAFAVWAPLSGAGGNGGQLVVLEGLLDAPCGRRTDALVDRQRLPQVRDGLAGVSVPQAGLPEPFQGACFLRGQADVTGDGQRLVMTLASLAGGRCPGRQLAEAVKRLSLAEPVAKVAEYVQSPLVARGRAPVVPGPLLHEAKVVESPSLTEQVTQVAVQRQGPLLAGGGGRVVPGFLLHHAEAVEGVGPAERVSSLAIEGQCPGQAGGGGRVI